MAGSARPLQGLRAAPNCALTVRVAIADDQPLVRAGLRLILEAEPDFEVVGEAANGAEAVALAESAEPEVLLMDVRMPGASGIEATREIRAAVAPQVRILILTTFDEDEYVYEALRAGASGFLLKDARAEDLVSAVRQVQRGEEGLLAPSITRRLIERFSQARPRRAASQPDFDDLTPREMEVLRQVARGLSNAEISEVLTVSETTVKTHVARILMKLGLRDRVQAVVAAYEAGLIEASP